jgi:drug/metabolite transporter (DMT)-like permease
MTTISPAIKHQTGVLLVLISALVFSSAGIFTKGVTADAWAVIFWRGLAAAIFTLGYLVMRGQLKKEIMLFSGPALAVTLLSALGTVAFIPAFKLTSVANVALIYAAAPFVTAALAWAFIGERPTRIVLIASLAAFGGVCVIFVGSAGGGGGLTGDMLAFWMTLMMAGMMVVYRRWPETTAALPAALASLVLLPVALAFGEPLTVLQSELPILVLFGLIFAVASVTLSEGARRLPPAETALLSALETPLAPALAFLILLEIPSTATVVGGIVIFCAVIWSLRAKQG